LDGIWITVTAALEYGLTALGSQVPGEVTRVPFQLFAQARMAATNGVGLEIVLRRYAAGHNLLVDAVLEEAIDGEVCAAQLRDAIGSLASGFDRILKAVAEEYTREVMTSRHKTGHHGLVRRLLAGEQLDLSVLDYNFGDHHLAMVGSGAAVSDAFSSLARRLDCELLLATPYEHAAWAWFASASAFDDDELALVASFPWPPGSAVACGEVCEGLPGWRLSHRQAAAAHLVAKRNAANFARYPDVALLACALQDNLLASSLRRTYLLPLERERDHGTAAKETLRAYLAASRNVSSAVAALRIHRRTVSSRLTMIERRLGRRLDKHCAELETALRLDELEGPPPSH